MKTIVKISILCLLAISSLQSNGQPKDTKTVTFICDIVCHSCEKKIMTNIPYEKGVKDVKVDIENKEVTVKYKIKKNSTEKLIEAFKELGYTATVKEEKQKTT